MPKSPHGLTLYSLLTSLLMVSMFRKLRTSIRAAVRSSGMVMRDILYQVKPIVRS